MAIPYAFSLFSILPFGYVPFILFLSNASLFFHVTNDDTLSILIMCVILLYSGEYNEECVKDDNQACNPMTFVFGVCIVQLSVIFTYIFT